MPASQENQSDGSGTPLPFKKRWADEADAQQEFDLEVDEIPQENTGAASNKHKESKVDDDQVPLKKTYDQSEMQESKYFFTVDHQRLIEVLLYENYRLYLDPYDASILTNCPELIDYPPCSYTKNILVFDGDDRRYDMVLSQYTSGGWIRYSLSADWNRFVRVHNLKAGDEITFYKNLDKSVSDDYYYILKYFRRPADRKGYVQNRKKPSNVGKKDVKGNYKVEDKHKGALPREAYCLSKILTSFEVIPENSKLYFDAYEAIILTDCPWILDDPPGTYSKNLVVFDGDDRRYNMLLTHYISGGKISYSLNTDWNRFVRTHNLKEGDEITFYRNFDRSISDDYYHIIKYFRKPADLKGFAPYRKKPSDAGQKDFKGSYMVEDKQKESEQTQFKVDKIPQENTSVPSNKDQESKVEDDVVEYTPDQTERNLLGPGSRAMQPEAYCLSKTLTSFEVIPDDSKLYFDAYEATMLTDCPWIVEYPPGSYSKNLLVFDADDRRYNMLLSHYISGGNISYSLNTDWNRFLRTHNLRDGDEITFYRILDRSVSDEYYYIIKYFRRPARP
ncbi:hypothetical protein Pfo_018524 [Paulownia fortunei]|nr:hypothetical protein Pfo_018524 [Paulownia fortunei]